MWLNGEVILPVTEISPELLHLSAKFRKGWNELAIRTFEEWGFWELSVAVMNSEGGSYRQLLTQALPPGNFELNTSSVSYDL